MASANDLIKYVTERIVRYMDLPPEQRKRSRPVRVKETWQYRWFGMIPVTFRIWIDKVFRKRRRWRR